MKMIKRLMKKLFFIILILFAGNATASSLPNCPSDPSVRWHNCFGTLTWADGDTYVGEYKDNKRHGQGTYTYANGEKYVGEWKDGYREGDGAYTFKSGKKKGGKFKKNKFLGNNEDG